jgi:ATP/ADP translocase
VWLELQEPPQAAKRLARVQFVALRTPLMNCCLCACCARAAAIGANIALVAAGCYIRLVNHTLSTNFAGDTQLLSLRVLIGTVMAMTVAMFASKAFIDNKILQPAAALAGSSGSSGGGSSKGPKKKKSKGTFSEGLAVLKNSPKIRNLALLVMSYGVGHR